MTLFAEETYAQLAPLEDEDAAAGYPIRALVRALGSMFAQPEEAIRALGDGKAAWERVFDPDRAPTWLLPFIGQAVGVIVDTSRSRAEQIEQIKEEGGWHRGTPNSTIDAVRGTLYSAINFVPNPSFEHGNAGWTSSGTFITSGSTATVVTGAAFSGASSMQIVTGAVAKRGIDAAMPGTFYAGATYVASVYVKGNAGGEKVKIAFGSSVGPEEQTKELTLTTEWQRLEVTWTPAANREGAELAIYGTAASAITFFADAFMVSAGTVALAYSDGDSEGWRWQGVAGESPSVNIATPAEGRIRLVERNSSAWTALIVVSPHEMFNLKETKRAAESQMPAGIVVTVEVSDLPLIDEGTREIDLATTHTIDTATLADVT